MRKEDLKNWTRDMLKDRIIELGGIIEQWKRDNEKMQIYKMSVMEVSFLTKKMKEINLSPNFKTSTNRTALKSICFM